LSRLAAFGRFWWEFVVGDDWLAAVAIAAAIAITALLAHSTIAAWWFLPPAVIVILYASLQRATRE
jgi:hypothetical protein